MAPTSPCPRYRHMVLLIVLVNLLVGAIPMSAGRAADQPIRIVAFGDSLTAGFGLPQLAAFPVQLQRALAAKGHAVEVINAGVSGDTTAGGLDRFDWSVPDKVDAAILELGANDALRGLDPGRARANLGAIVQKMKGRGMEVLIAGMAAPRNWGDAYVAAFDPIFPDLARTHDALLYPFFLEGVAMRPELNLADGLHPTEAGIAEIVRRILPQVEALIGRVKARRSAAAGNAR
jgi:acyl-CoA thioesterase-1